MCGWLSKFCLSVRKREKREKVESTHSEEEESYSSILFSSTEEAKKFLNPRIGNSVPPSPPLKAQAAERMGRIQLNSV